MLTELSVVEQRYLAVREVLDGVRVSDVATRYGVDRRTVFSSPDLPA
jgi:transposase